MHVRTLSTRSLSVLCVLGLASFAPACGSDSGGGYDWVPDASPDGGHPSKGGDDDASSGDDDGGSTADVDLPDVAGDASTGAIGTRSPAGFFHPGIVVTQGGLNAIRNRLVAGDADLKEALAAAERDIDDASLPACPAEDSAGRCALPKTPAAPASHVTVTCGSHSAAPPGDTSCDDEKANGVDDVLEGWRAETQALERPITRPK